MAGAVAKAVFTMIMSRAVQFFCAVYCSHFLIFLLLVHAYKSQNILPPLLSPSRPENASPLLSLPCTSFQLKPTDFRFAHFRFNEVLCALLVEGFLYTCVFSSQGSGGKYKELPELEMGGRKKNNRFYACRVDFELLARGSAGGVMSSGENTG